MARGDLGELGKLLLDRHVGLADRQKEAAQRASADLELGAQELQILLLLVGQVLQRLGRRLDDARQLRGRDTCMVIGLSRMSPPAATLNCSAETVRDAPAVTVSRPCRVGGARPRPPGAATADQREAASRRW